MQTTAKKMIKESDDVKKLMVTKVRPLEEGVKQQVMNLLCISPWCCERDGMASLRQLSYICIWQLPTQGQKCKAETHEMNVTCKLHVGELGDTMDDMWSFFNLIFSQKNDL